MEENAPPTSPQESGSTASPRRLTARPAGQTIDDAKQELFDEVRGNFDSFLDARPDDTPFCYWWGPTNTHRTWERGSGKELWDLDPDDLKDRMPAFLTRCPRHTRGLQ